MKHCFYCETKLDKKTCFKLQVDMAEGRAEYLVCPECAKEFNDVLKDIEEVKNDDEIYSGT